MGLRGQIFTTAASLKMGAFAVGAALAGPAVERLGAGGALVAAGAVHVLAALLGMSAGATLGSRAYPPAATTAGAGGPAPPTLPKG